MGYGIRLYVWGDRACFTRPEMKAERVSYDVMTPSAARGILEAIHWKPAIRWVVDRIHVLNEIAFDSVRRNEVENKISASQVKSAMNGRDIVLNQASSEERQQRMTVMLRDVAYVIEAHFEMTSSAGETDNPEKHYSIFSRRARNGQFYHQPYFGCREFPVHFELLEDGQPLPASYYAQTPERDLQWMLWDLEYGQDITPKFFRATMREGVIEVPDLHKREVRS
ncbi:type I-C CRISPR-associated protein Cas5c [Saccharibacillus sp. CPCC 101409]|uniref:type I-C CRISPR-associated protein Cas5c n=1 Tax=Saccharibacillus sp. CPCC 101409 TaxID=3058041 RepID=UPI0026733A34|nr:type I-C CRISPR-associated protein Cas5c [Saccharibacillus sp. CPCC 101409]MDO3409432.1 type I-C CRISPR-associated protein Cas5c [Saccharibacillus sp. CPCC 101409]